MTTESVVLCEGYHDRAFWAGWLESVECTSLFRGSGIRIQDPWGVTVGGGDYAYNSKTGRFVRIVPCGGDIRVILREASNRLSEQQQRYQQVGAVRLARLVLNIDSDVRMDNSSTRTGFQEQDLEKLLKEFDCSAAETNDGDFALFDGATLVSLARWEASDATIDGLPSQQTLERVVCAALVAAYPERGEPVRKWLDSRPNAPEAGPKEYGGSHMAGWYADAGSEAFYRVIWSDPKIATELQSRLAESGAWRIAEALAQ